LVVGEGRVPRFLERDQAAGEHQQREVVLIFLRPAGQQRSVRLTSSTRRPISLKDESDRLNVNSTDEKDAHAEALLQP